MQFIFYLFVAGTLFGQCVVFQFSRNSSLVSCRLSSFSTGVHSIFDSNEKFFNIRSRYCAGYWYFKPVYIALTQILCKNTVQHKYSKTLTNEGTSNEDSHTQITCDVRKNLGELKLSTPEIYSRRNDLNTHQQVNLFNFRTEYIKQPTNNNTIQNYRTKTIKILFPTVECIAHHFLPDIIIELMLFAKFSHITDQCRYNFIIPETLSRNDSN